MSIARLIDKTVISPTLSYDYIIYQDGNLYFAFNTKTNQIDFVNIDAGTVIQQAINALPNGGKIFIKGGVYSISEAVISNVYVEIIGEGIDVTILKCAYTLANQSGFMFQLDGGGYVSDLTIDGNADGIPSPNNVHCIGCAASPPLFILERLKIKNASGALIYLNTGGNAIPSIGSQVVILKDLILQHHPTKGADTIASGWLDYAIFENIDANGNGYSPTGGAFLLDDAGANTKVVEKCRVYNYSSTANVPVINLNQYKQILRDNIFYLPNAAVCEIPLSNADLVIMENNYMEAGTPISLSITNITFKDLIIRGNNLVGHAPAGYGPNAIVIQNLTVNRGIVENNSVWGYSGTTLSSAGIAVLVPNVRVKNNPGWDTGNFKTSGLSISVGTGGAYGSASTITSPSGIITYPRIKITWGGTFGTGETVTVQITAVYSDGTTASITKSATATGSLWLTDDDVFALIAQGKDIVQIQVSASSNLASTSVTVTVNAYGKA